ncbi:MAG: TolC family protein [Synergistes sp.]|nr:TolC family protein [Synergistes sp.]
MIKKILTAAVLFFAAASAAFAEDDALLASLIAAADKQNPMITAAAEQVAAARERLKVSEAKLGPSASLVGAGLFINGGVNKEINFMGMTNTFGVLDSQTYAAAVVLTQSIYSGGSLQAKRQSDKIALDAAEASAERTREGVENSVRRAYYAHRCAQAKVFVAEEACRLSKNHQKDAEKLFAAGVVALNDVLRSKVAVAEAELNVIRMKNAADITEAALRRAVGADLPQEIKQSEKLETLLSASDVKKDIIKADLDTALKNRKELKAYTLLSEQAKKLAEAAKGQSLPQILGLAGYGTLGKDAFSSENTEPFAVLQLTWSLYNGGEVKAKTAEAQANARRLLACLEDMKNIIRMEITQAASSSSSAQSRLEVARRQLAQAREDYRIAQRRYTESVGTNLDALDARLALTNSMTEVVTAVYDIKTAEADIIYAMGQ